MMIDEASRGQNSSHRPRVDRRSVRVFRQNCLPEIAAFGSKLRRSDDLVILYLRRARNDGAIALCGSSVAGSVVAGFLIRSAWALRCERIANFPFRADFSKHRMSEGGECNAMPGGSRETSSLGNASRLVR